MRLVLEDAGVPYLDVARRPEDEGGGFEPLKARLHGGGDGFPIFAPPVLVFEEDGQRREISQMPNICHFIACRHGLAPAGAVLQAQCLSVMLTVADAVVEAHDVHHPISSKLYYEDQKPEALRSAEIFVGQRLKEWLGYFEILLQRGQGFAVGGSHSYADLAIFQLLLGLEYAFPRSYAREAASKLQLENLRMRVGARPNISRYLASDRRIPFNEHGGFRHYPELDIS